MDTTRLVRDFHVKNDLRVDVDITRGHDENYLWMVSASRSLARLASEAYSRSSDARCERLGLIMEELGEMAVAMARRDTVQVADGLADLRYVVDGTAVTFGLPLEALVVEVHSSNMTKDTSTLHGEDRGPEVERTKGPDYRPPDIAGVLRKSRTTVTGSEL